MITIINAIDYATDHGVIVTDGERLRGSRINAFQVAKRPLHSLQVKQTEPGSRRWIVEGLAGSYSKAAAIVEAVNQIRAMDKTAV